MTEDFTTPDTFGVRIGGLPVPTLDDMRSPELWRQAEAVREGESQLDGQASALSDMLYEEIGRAGSGKPLLVAVRRAIHNRRPLAERHWNDEVRALLPRAVVDEVDGWVRLRADHEEAVARLDDLIGHHLRTQQVLLRKAASDPVLQHGLVLSSPVLLAEVRKWLARPDERAPERSLAHRLAKYLARVTMKTSPFSTFTASGLGTWDGGARDRASTGPGGHSVAELNVWVVQQIVRALGSRPELAGRARLRLNPSARLTEDRWEFLGTGAEEPLRTLPGVTAVRECVAVVREDRPTREEAARIVADRTGSDQATATAYLARLEELGLLEAERPFADQALDHVAEVRSWLAGATSAGLVRIERELAVIAETLAAYPRLSDPTQRVRATSAVETALRRIRDLAGPDRISLPDKNSVIENALVAAPYPGPDRRAWGPVLRDLDAVRQCYAVLDPGLPGRVALADLFAERVGPGEAVPFLTFHRLVQTWLRDDPALPALLSVAVHGYGAMHRHRLPRLGELASLRDELCEVVRAAPAEAQGIIRVAPERLLSVVERRPAWMRAPDSVTYYGQPFGTRSAPEFVVNAVNSGHGRGRDRIRRLLTQAEIEAVRDTTVDTTPPSPGLVHADTCRHFGSNVGLRASAVAAEIEYPGGLSLRPPEHRIRLGDLFVRHVPGPGLLTLHTRGRDGEVRPVHPNLIAELWLPPALRLLLQTFGSTSNLLIPGRRIFGDPSLSEVREVLAEPRVVVGRTTVSRRQWVLPPGAVPRREKGESDRSLLLRLVAWLAEHGMPQRCFVRALDPQSVISGEVWRVKSRKPLYVDFANLLLVGVFERLLAAGAGQVVFLQEALPGPCEMPDHDGSGPRVTEFLVEINEGRTQ
ncbi:lantibiotic dehydratase [Streptomyces sp. DSM 41527]|uniref:Lantibiotic dehydratase n=1 Tax=Streptomyces mooreae TaxID=3075523 RepID=A0ABU2TD76_9ACTN|nr:lantibiotic dehydratase [Streptomyces sp. DSM 41527]MDT0458891.1 lantibiotic dehydratase [Streptomyces sp. DSM 41527]